MKLKDQELVAKIAKAVELHDKLREKLEDIDELRGFVQELKAAGIETTLAELKEEFSKLRAQSEAQIEAIRTSRSPFLSPGAENANFNMTRACYAVITGDWSKAGKEKEILDDVRVQREKMQAGDDESSGWFIPDQLIADVIQKIYAKSRYIALDGDGETRVTVLSGLVGQTVKIPKLKGGIISYWIGEGDEYVQSKMKSGDKSMTWKKLGVLVKLTKELAMTASPAFDAALRRDMSKAIAIEVDRVIPFGKGTENQPLGITRQNGVKVYSIQKNTSAGDLGLGLYGQVGDDLAGTTNFQADWQGGNLHYDHVSDIKLILEENDIGDTDGTFAASPRVWRRLAKLRSDNYSGQAQDKQAYLIGSPILSMDRLAALIGPFFGSTKHGLHVPGASVGAPTTVTDTKFTTGIYGDLSEVILGRWGGLTIDSDLGRGIGFTSDHTYIKMTLFCDTMIRDESSLIVVPDIRART